MQRVQANRHSAAKFGSRPNWLASSYLRRRSSRYYSGSGWKIEGTLALHPMINPMDSHFRAFQIDPPCS